MEVIKILEYTPGLQPAFEKLNRDWISKYFVMEPIDVEVVTKPEEYILKDGGTILFAAHRAIEEQVPRRELAIVDADSIVPDRLIRRRQHHVRPWRQRCGLRARAGCGGDALRPGRPVQEVVKVLPEAAVQAQLRHLRHRCFCGRRRARDAERGQDESEQRFHGPIIRQSRRPRGRRLEDYGRTRSQLNGPNALPLASASAPGVIVRRTHSSGVVLPCTTSR